MLSNQCRAHLHDVGETAGQHMKSALWIALRLQLLVPALIIHAVAPRFFTHTATNVLQKILKDRNNGNT